MAIATVTLRELYEQMLLIRTFETEAERQYKAAHIGGYCHLSSGQEAATVGATHALDAADLLVTGYRCHGFALARGVPPDAVMAELFGRVTGVRTAAAARCTCSTSSAATTVAGGSSPASFRSPPASRSVSCARDARRPFSASSATARSTWAPGTSR